jgi:hypothetical protein
VTPPPPPKGEQVENKGNIIGEAKETPQ